MRKEEAVVEGVLGVEAVGEDDVGYLEGQDGIKVGGLLGSVGGDDGGGVEEGLGDDDGVADGERFEGLGEEGADADGRGDGDVVVDEDVVG